MSARTDVIVVLGAAPLADGRPSPAMRRRVAAGVALFRAGAAPWLLFSGGPVRHAEPEAEAMAGLAREAGVPGDAIAVETRSRNTFENAVYSGRIMADHGWRTALLVTDRCHLPRARFVFRQLGLRVAGHGVRGHAWAGWLREGAAFARSAALFALGRHKPVVARVWRR